MAEGQLDHGRIALQLGRRDRRCAAWTGFFADRPTRCPILRGRPAWAEFVLFLDRGSRRQHWTGRTVFPVNASRRVGLRRRSRSIADGRGSRRKENRGGGGSVKAGA